MDWVNELHSFGWPNLDILFDPIRVSSLDGQRAKHHFQDSKESRW